MRTDPGPRLRTAVEFATVPGWRRTMTAIREIEDALKDRSWCWWRH
jgi:hypothetical protein